MAGEFGISADEVMGLLRQMDIPVRSHLSPLTDDQVARVRARWEREKRARSAPPPPVTSTRRRRTGAEPVEQKPAEGSGIRRRRAADLPPEPEPVFAAEPEVESTPAPAP